MIDEKAAPDADRTAPRAYPKLIEAYPDLVMIERRRWLIFQSPTSILKEAMALVAREPTGPKVDALKRVTAAFEAETAAETDPLFRLAFPATGGAP